MTDFDSLVVGFKDNMAKTALWINGNDQTDIQTDSGPVPTLAKLISTADARLAAMLPDLSTRLTLAGDGQYSAEQKAWGRKNLGLDKVDNVADVDKPLSTQQQQAIQSVMQTAQSKEDPSKRNVLGGYFAYDGSRLPIRNGADTFFGYLYNNITARRDWLLPDASGTLALKSDITGNNSGTNTGDETTATIKGKLNITTLSGANTGDETQTSILAKLGIPSISGDNSGDETRESIVDKIGYEVMPLGARNAISGVAPLDENRLVPVENLPPAFESVEVVDNYGEIPMPGVDKRLYITAVDSGLYYWNGGAYMQLNTVMNNTDQLGEGQEHLYFTQLRAIEAVLTTYVVGPATAVNDTDTTVSAISKLQAQITAAITDYTSQFESDAININNAVATAKQYTDSMVVGLVKDCGNWDASTNAFPTTGGTGENGAILRGNLWYVNVAGTLGGKAVGIGDSFRALVDNPDQMTTNWAVLESNLGYVPYNATNPDGFISGIDAEMVKDALGVPALSGSNTGDETQDSILNKLGLQELSGINTGDETTTTIKSKLGIETLSGVNTGDETRDTILTKIGFTPLDAAGGTVGSLESGQTWHTTDVVKGDLAVQTKGYLQAGGGGFRTGGNGRTIYKSETGSNLWMEGIYPTSGLSNWMVYDLANSRTVFEISSSSGLATLSYGLNVKGGALNVARATDIPSAITLDLNAMDGNYGHLTGTQTVFSIMLADGAVRVLRIMNGCTFKSGGAIVTPGHVDINAKPNDILILQGLSSGLVQILSYIPAGNYAKPDVVKTVTASTAATTLDLASAAVFEVTLAASTSLVFDFSNVPPLANQTFAFVLTIINDNTAGRGVSFPAGTKWAGGQIPNRSTGANARDDWYFYSRDGVNWIGSLSNQDIR